MPGRISHTLSAVRLALLLSACVSVPSLAPAAEGGPFGDPARGEALVEQNCARCHAIRETGESPNPDAPPFRIVVQRYPVENLEEALAEGILVGHDTAMPQLSFEPDEIDDILGYLDGLSPQ